MGSPTWLLASSKPPREGEKKTGTTVLCDKIISSNASIPLTLFYQSADSHRSGYTRKGVITQEWKPGGSWGSRHKCAHHSLPSGHSYYCPHHMQSIPAPPPGPQECYPVTVPAQSPYPHCLNQVQVRRRLFRDISSLSANLYNYQDKLFSLHTLNIQVSP